MDPFRKWFGGPVELRYRIGEPDEGVVPSNIREIVYSILHPLVRDAFGSRKEYRISDDIFDQVGIAQSRITSARSLLNDANAAITEGGATATMVEPLFDNPERYIPFSGYRIAFRVPLGGKELYVIFSRSAGG
jgi:hypothetical protein